MNCILLGAPVQEGTGRLGCNQGPAALRRAGLADVLGRLGHSVDDRGDLASGALHPVRHGNLAVKALPEVSAWAEIIADEVYHASAEGMPIVLGGDHSIAAGTLPALNRHAIEAGRKLFVLWLDAHPDFHTLDTTRSGNLHGVPLAYATGRAGFGGYFPPLPLPLAVEPGRICMMGIRSVDPAERDALATAGITVHDMTAIEVHGIDMLLDAFLARVAREDGVLHVSFDVDFLDPAIAPAVGTAVPGGPGAADAHRVMRKLHESGRVGSLDLAELNPSLDQQGRTARLIVDLVATLMGRPVPTSPPGALRHV